MRNQESAGLRGPFGKVSAKQRDTLGGGQKADDAVAVGLRQVDVLWVRQRRPLAIGQDRDDRPGGTVQISSRTWRGDDHSDRSVGQFDHRANRVERQRQ